MLNLPYSPWQVSSPHGAVSTVPQFAAPLGVKPQYVQHPRWQVFSLTQDIWVVQLVNYNVMILTETNISDETYCQNRIGYKVVCLPMTATAARVTQGRVVLIV